MNLHTRLSKRLLKSFVAVSLSFAIALTGSMIVAPASTHTVEAASRADSVLSTAAKYLGTPYKFGAASGQTRNFDCSSFTQYVFKKYGVSLPRTSKAQSGKGTFVSRSNLKKGDLVFFSTPSSKGKIAHVGIYAGNGKFIHTYGKPGVMYSSLSSSWWSSHYITARRVL
ncbi:MAG: C40 family peptidase [Paenibacillaceae bacterium]|nr:C40 family peptidase [Paenibacillaceae bacterium]